MKNVFARLSSPARILMTMLLLLPFAENARAQANAAARPAGDCRDDCPKTSTRWADRKQSDFLTSGARLSVAGIRGSALLVTGSDAPGHTGGVMAASRSEAYAQDRWLTIHRLQYAGLGWGSGGLEGETGGMLDAGVRFAAGKLHGPFIRGGTEGYAGGNRRVYSAFLELPRAQLGYQILTGTLLLEAGGGAGAMLLGRYSAGDHATRDLNLSLAWGGHIAVHRAPIRFDASIKRVEAGGIRLGHPVYFIRAATCSHAGRFAMCSDLRYLRGDLRAPDGGLSRGAASLYAGFMVGLASIEL
jgi:hypothetical protein